MWTAYCAINRGQRNFELFKVKEITAHRRLSLQLESQFPGACTGQRGLAQRKPDSQDSHRIHTNKYGTKKLNIYDSNLINRKKNSEGCAPFPLLLFGKDNNGLVFAIKTKTKFFFFNVNTFLWLSVSGGTLSIVISSRYR